MCVVYLWLMVLFDVVCVGMFTLVIIVICAGGSCVCVRVFRVMSLCVL